MSAIHSHIHTHSNYSDTFTGLHSKKRANTHSLQRGEVIDWLLTTTTTHTAMNTPNNNPPPKCRGKKSPSCTMRRNRLLARKWQKKSRGSIKEGKRKRVTKLIWVRKTQGMKGVWEEGEGVWRKRRPPICPSFPPLLPDKNRVLTGKQGQSPCMSACVSDLRAHAAFTGTEAQTHAFQMTQL